jgi:glycosyltransferase involved in cell wall biosynthesis
MHNNKKVIIIMPAYNAEKTLLKTYNEVIEQDCVDLVIVVDDASTDKTVKIAKKLDKVIIFRNKNNLGYGANQKKCYQLALDNGGDIIIMVHPDYQYTPKLIPAMASLIGNNIYHCVIGSRILGNSALKGGMPYWKYFCNRILTFVENILLGTKLSEYHTGYRAFSRELLDALDCKDFSDDFVFDNQILAQVIWYGCTIAEITCPTKYFEDASSINFRRSVKYGIGCIITAVKYRLAMLKLFYPKIFSPQKRSIFDKHTSRDNK